MGISNNPGCADWATSFGTSRRRSRAITGYCEGLQRRERGLGRSRCHLWIVRGALMFALAWWPAFGHASQGDGIFRDYLAASAFRRSICSASAVRRRGHTFPWCESGSVEVPCKRTAAGADGAAAIVADGPVQSCGPESCGAASARQHCPLDGTRARITRSIRRCSAQAPC